MKTIEGIIPVMLTPFTADNKIDYLGLKRLNQLQYRKRCRRVICRVSVQ